MTLNYIERISEEIEIPITYERYMDVDNVMCLGEVALAYRTIDAKGKPMLVTNPNEFPSSCTKKYIMDCIEAEQPDLGIIKRINWQNFQAKVFVIADIETTGFSMDRGAQIIQIGAIKINDKGEELDRFNRYIKPTIKIPANITELTGITNDMVKNEDPMGSVLRDFFNFFKGSVLVFHNAPFDWDRFLVPSFEKIGIKLSKTYPRIDTKEISKYCFPLEKEHDLESMCTRLNVLIKDHHNAFADVTMTMQAFIKMREMCIDNFKTLPYIQWSFKNVPHKIKINRVSRWDVWMPRKKKYSKLRFYVTFTCDGVQGNGYYDFITKDWYLQNCGISFDAYELKEPVFKFFQVNTYDEMLKKLATDTDKLVVQDNEKEFNYD